MKRPSLLAAYVGATLATFLALSPGEPASAHVDVRPRVVEQGAIAELRVELPQLRPGPAPTALEVTGDGIDVLAVSLEGTQGPETVWAVRVRVAGPPRQAQLVLRAVFADGESVEVDDTLTVVPAPADDPFPWALAGAGAVLALGFAALALRVARRKA